MIGNLNSVWSYTLFQKRSLIWWWAKVKKLVCRRLDSVRLFYTDALHPLVHPEVCISSIRPGYSKSACTSGVVHQLARSLNRSSGELSACPRGWYTSGCLILISGLYIRRAVPQLVQDGTHQVVSLKLLYRWVVHSGCSESYIWVHLRGCTIGVCSGCNGSRWRLILGFYICLEADWQDIGWL